MATATRNLVVTGLSRDRMAALTTKAKQLGMTPERYVKRLVEDDLALDREARETPLADIVGPGCEVDEAELDALVDAARQRHYERTSGKR